MRQEAHVFLVDVSGSMMGDKFARLKKRVHSIWPENNKAAILAYSDVFEWVDGPDQIPQPGGSTDLAGALREAAKALPGAVLVVSDGMPDDPDDCFVAIKDIPGTVGTIYIGADDAEDAKAFMQKLGRVGGGGYKYRDISRVGELETAVREMLALPAPIPL